jgi:hypothetical protein
MQGNEVGTRLLRPQGCRDGIRIFGVPLLTQGRDVINIDA